MKNFTYYFNLNGLLKKTIEDTSEIFIKRGGMILIGDKEIHEMNEVILMKINVPYNLSKLQIKKISKLH